MALVKSLTEVPRHVASILRQDEIYLAVAQDLAKARDVLYLGRGSSFPIALEGALKLKEISYIHAEGYAAGELKHGPIALIDESVPVIVVAPEDDLFEKTVSNLQEVAARGGQIILISDAPPGKSRMQARCPHPDAEGRHFHHAVDLCSADSTHRLSDGGPDRHRRRSATQSGEIGDGRMMGVNDGGNRALKLPSSADCNKGREVAAPT